MKHGKKVAALIAAVLMLGSIGMAGCKEEAPPEEPQEPTLEDQYIVFTNNYGQSYRIDLQHIGWEWHLVSLLYNYHPGRVYTFTYATYYTANDEPTGITGGYGLPTEPVLEWQQLTDEDFMVYGDRPGRYPIETYVPREEEGEYYNFCLRVVIYPEDTIIEEGLEQY